MKYKGKKKKSRKKHKTISRIIKNIKSLFSDLRIQLLNVNDTRKKNYTTYETDVIPLERILAYIFGVSSMNEITERFNTEEVEVLVNFVLLARRHRLSSLPNGDVVNDFSEELEPEEIEKNKKQIW